MPVLNEEHRLSESLLALQPYRHYGHELIVVDGGSEDHSLSIARQYSDAAMVAPKGRARQMNRGAREASGDVLLFLHADTVLPVEAMRSLSDLTDVKNVWGRFDVRLSGSSWQFRVIEKLMNLRSRLTGVVTGDQSVFISRELFEAVGGFPEIDLMEDIAISKQLKKISKPVCLSETVTTSSRRWESNGVISTILLMWTLRLFYFLGISPDRLNRMYR
jgi:rSAM/selenodomain-associated transferase 2